MPVKEEEDFLLSANYMPLQDVIKIKFIL